MASLTSNCKPIRFSCPVSSQVVLSSVFFLVKGVALDVLSFFTCFQRFFIGAGNDFYHTCRAIVRFFQVFTPVFMIRQVFSHYPGVRNWYPSLGFSRCFFLFVGTLSQVFSRRVMQTVTTLFFVHGMVPFCSSLGIFSYTRGTRGFICVLCGLTRSPRSNGVLCILFRSNRISVPSFHLFRCTFLYFSASHGRFSKNIHVLVTVLLTSPLRLGF